MFWDDVHYVQRVSCVFLHLSLLCTTNMWCLFWSKLDVLNRIFKYSVPNRQNTMFWDALHYLQLVSCALLHLSALCTTNMCWSFWTKLVVLNRIFKYSVPNRQNTMFWDALHYLQLVSCALLHLSALCTTNMCWSFWTKLVVLNRIFKYSVQNRQKSYSIFMSMTCHVHHV